MRADEGYPKHSLTDAWPTASTRSLLTVISSDSHLKPQSLRCKTKGTRTKAKHKTAAWRSQPPRPGPQTAAKSPMASATAGTRGPRCLGTWSPGVSRDPPPGSQGCTSSWQQALGQLSPLSAQATPHAEIHGQRNPRPDRHGQDHTEKQACGTEIPGSSARRTQNPAITPNPGPRAGNVWQLSSAQPQAEAACVPSTAESPSG